MKCADCSFCWQGDENDYPCCHCEGIAPCEEDDYVDNEDDEDYPELNFDAPVDYRDIGNYIP